MTIELKIKTKHLSEEAKIIRFEERKLLKQLRYFRKIGTANRENNAYLVARWNHFNLQQHRKIDVRNENRASYLARAFLEGKAYSTIEQKRKPEKEDVFIGVILPRVLKMVQKYGGSKYNNTTIEQLREWSKIEG